MPPPLGATTVAQGMQLQRAHTFASKYYMSQRYKLKAVGSTSTSRNGLVASTQLLPQLH